MTEAHQGNGHDMALRTLAVDIGGSGVKALVLNDEGTAVTERARVATPHPATPQAVIDAIAGLAKSQGPYDRISVGFPGVVRQGVTLTAHNLDETWIGFDFATALSDRLEKPVRVANDADVQGYGAIRGDGVELVLTLGTGLGSALFVDGKLVPNLELAHHRFRSKKTYEECLGNSVLQRKGRKDWNKAVRKAIRELEATFNYDTVYIGGGNASKIDAEVLPANARIVSNVAGLTGGIALWRRPEHRRSTLVVEPAEPLESSVPTSESPTPLPSSKEAQ